MFEILDFFELQQFIGAAASRFDEPWPEVVRALISGAYLIVIFGLARQLAMRADYILSGVMRSIGSRPFEFQYVLGSILDRLRIVGVILALSIIATESAIYLNTIQSGFDNFEIDQGIVAGLHWYQRCFYELEWCF